MDARICFVTATFPPILCGVGDYTFLLANSLRRNGMEVSVITTPFEARGQGFEENAIIYESVPSWGFQGLPTLLGTIKQINPDILNIQYTPSLFGRRNLAINLLPLYLCESLRARVVTTLHELYTPYRYSAKEIVAGTYERLKDSLLIAFSNRIVVTLPRRKRLLQRLFPWKSGRIYYIPVGANFPVVSVSRGDRIRFRTELGVRSDEILLGSFGTFHTDKQYETLFVILRGLLNRGHPLKLLLLGEYKIESPYCQRLLRFQDELSLEPYVIWAGRCSPKKVSQYLGLMDIYVMTDLRGVSTRKGSLMAALAHGLPLVASKGEDTPAVFQHGVNCLLIESRSTEEWVGVIESLICDPGKRVMFGNQIKTLFETNYSWSVITDRMIKIYNLKDSVA